MKIYINECDETMWYNEENWRKDLNECLLNNWVDIAESNGTSLEMLAVNFVVSLCCGDFVTAGDWLRQMKEAYAATYKIFIERNSRTIEGDVAKVMDIAEQMYENGYMWGDYEED